MISMDGTFYIKVSNDDEWYVDNKLRYKKDLSLDTTIYRYVSMPHLLEMLHTGQLKVANRSCFSDILDAKGRHLNVRFNFDTFVDASANVEETMRIVTQENERKQLLYSTYISCWTFDRHENVDESVLMWKTYNRECRIKTSIGKIVKYASDADIESLLSAVKYKNKDGFIISDESRLFTKLSYYKDEQELRVCFIPNSEDNDIRDMYSFRINPEDLILEILFTPYLSKEEYVFYERALITDYPWLKDRIHKSAISER